MIDVVQCLHSMIGKALIQLCKIVLQMIADVTWPNAHKLLKTIKRYKKIAKAF